MGKIFQMQKTFYKVADFITWQRSGTLVLSPKFQRRAVWKPGAKSYLIDTIVRGLPVPIIFLRDQRIDLDKFEPSREVIDGQQRLRTILSYVVPDSLEDYDPQKDDFTVSKNHNTDLAGKQFHQLGEDIREQILEYEFNVHILSPRVDDREIIQIFRRMNATTYTLNKQELRNAEFFGEFKTVAYILAAEQLNRWREWEIFSESQISRMDEVLHTSECIIFMINSKIQEKSEPSINKIYKEYDEEFPLREEVEKRFRATMDELDKCYRQEKTREFLRRKIFSYPLFAAIYAFMFGKTPISESAKTKTLSSGKLSSIATSIERIKCGEAAEPIIEVVGRSRTTSLREREILFNYFLDSISDA